jgi:hypothetical protein
MERFQCRGKKVSEGDTTIGEEEGVERDGHGKDHMEVRHGQQVACLSLHPSRLVKALALRAMPVSA